MKALLQRITQQSVLIIGDVVLDHYVWGDVERISPEAPVPVLDVEDDTYMVGMGANVAINIKSLGGKAEICGWVGQDEAGMRLTEILSRSGVRFDPRFQRAELNTLLKTRVMARRQQICRLDREGHPSLYSMDDDATMARIEEKLVGVQAVIISDYDKGVISEKLLTRILELKAKYGYMVSIDPKPSRALPFVGPDLMTPNRVEALQLAGLKQRPHEDFPAEAVCKAIWEKHRPKNLVVTLGPKGMLLSHEGKVTATIPTYAREVYDVSGAGDTVIAALTLALSAGIELREAAHFANNAAGVVVGKLGTATATAEEVLEFEEEIALHAHA